MATIHAGGTDPGSLCHLAVCSRRGVPFAPGSGLAPGTALPAEHSLQGPAGAGLHSTACPMKAG